MNMVMTSGSRSFSKTSKTNIEGGVMENEPCATFVLYLEPFLNTYYKAYQNVITANVVPCGPFSHLVSKISISAFQSMGQYASPFYRGFNCINVVTRYPGACIKDAGAFMGQDDIPAILGYLIENGYTVDTALMNMLNISRIVMGGVSDMRVVEIAK